MTVSKPRIPPTLLKAFTPEIEIDNVVCMVTMNQGTGSALSTSGDIVENKEENTCGRISEENERIADSANGLQGIFSMLKEEGFVPTKDDFIRLSPRIAGAQFTSPSPSNLPDLEPKKMKYIDKITIFEAVSDLHTLGVNHYDLSPQDVTHHADGTYRIIDFTQSNIHNCAGIQTTNDIEWKEESCAELALMWRILVKAKLYTHKHIAS